MIQELMGEAGFECENCRFSWNHEDIDCPLCTIAIAKHLISSGEATVELISDALEGVLDIPSVTESWRQEAGGKVFS